MRSRKVKHVNGPVGVFATAIHFWFSLCWVFWFDVAFICIFETEESVIIWIVDINKFFESNDCSFITLTDCILACSLWIFADNFIISCYFELKQGHYHIIWLGIVMYNPILTNMKVFQILISNSPNSTMKIAKIVWKNFVVPSSGQKS